MKKLAMVIVNYNDYNTTNRLIENIKDYSCLNLIIIVDNHSTDHSYQKLKKKENEKIHLLSNQSKSYASGLNCGARYAIDKLGSCNIIFSNSDILIEKEEDLAKLSSDTKHHHIGVVAPVINEKGKKNRGWIIPSANKEILFNLPLISRYFKNKFLKYPENHYEEELSIVGAVSGCFFLVDSNLLEEVNYFDEKTYLYYEENILAKKVEKTTYQIVIDNQVEVIHDHSVTIDKSVNRINKYKILKTSQEYYVKNYLKANKIQLILLWFTNKLSLGILYLRLLGKK